MKSYVTTKDSKTYKLTPIMGGGGGLTASADGYSILAKGTKFSTDRVARIVGGISYLTIPSSMGLGRNIPTESIMEITKSESTSRINGIDSELSNIEYLDDCFGCKP